MQKESTNFQNMLQGLQSQFSTLDQKYNKAKHLVREYQQREVDMVIIITLQIEKNLILEK